MFNCILLSVAYKWHCFLSSLTSFEGYLDSVSLPIASYTESEICVISLGLFHSPHVLLQINTFQHPAPTITSHLRFCSWGTSIKARRFLSRNVPSVTQWQRGDPTRWDPTCGVCLEERRDNHPAIHIRGPTLKKVWISVAHAEQPEINDVLIVRVN